MNEAEQSSYWFPAKKYGWGWGLPTRWEGWLTMFVFVVLMIINAMVFKPGTRPLEFFSSKGVLIVAIIAVCYLKGAPPAWRWGKS